MIAWILINTVTGQFRTGRLTDGALSLGSFFNKDQHPNAIPKLLELAMGGDFIVLRRDEEHTTYGLESFFKKTQLGWLPEVTFCCGHGKYTYPNGDTGVCYRCAGKGTQTIKDQMRNMSYAEHMARREEMVAEEEKGDGLTYEERMRGCDPKGTEDMMESDLNICPCCGGDAKVRKDGVCLGCWEPPTCQTCRGTGEGGMDGESCRSCGGQGQARR